MKRHGEQVTMIFYGGLSIEDLVLQCSLYLPVIHDKFHDDSSHAEHPNHCQPRSRLRLGRLLACRHGVHHWFDQSNDLVPRLEKAYRSIMRWKSLFGTSTVTQGKSSLLNTYVHGPRATFCVDSLQYNVRLRCGCLLAYTNLLWDHDLYAMRIFLPRRHP